MSEKAMSEPIKRYRVAPRLEDGIEWLVAASDHDRAIAGLTDQLQSTQCTEAMLSDEVKGLRERVADLEAELEDVKLQALADGGMDER